MTAPDTNIEKQERRHWGPLAGIAAGIGFVALLTFVWLADGSDEVGVPEQAPVVAE